MSSSKHGPIFIVGAPRSGTTLLQYMLRAHPRISLPTGESHFFIPLLRRAAEFGDLSRPEALRAVLRAMHARSADFLETDLHGLRFDVPALAGKLADAGCATMPAVIAGLFELNAAGEGKARWGDKTPYYVLHMTRLKAAFPDAQFVHLIRDGRDVALSLFDRRDDFRVYNSYFAGKYWQMYLEQGREQGRCLPADAYHELRYEELIVDPEAALRQLCAFLGEDFCEELLRYKRAGEAGKTPLVSQPLRADNAEKWRQGMSTRQLRLFEAAAGRTLRDLGYPLATSAQALPKPLRAGYWLHNRLRSAWRNRFGAARAEA
jgi:hypothetical protein